MNHNQTECCNGGGMHFSRVASRLYCSFLNLFLYYFLNFYNPKEVEILGLKN